MSRRDRDRRIVGMQRSATDYLSRTKIMLTVAAIVVKYATPIRECHHESETPRSGIRGASAGLSAIGLTTSPVIASIWACDLAALPGPDLKGEADAPQRQVSADEEKGQAFSLRLSPGQRRAVADIAAPNATRSDAPLERVGAGRASAAKPDSQRRVACSVPPDTRDVDASGSRHVATVARGTAVTRYRATASALKAREDAL